MNPNLEHLGGKVDSVLDALVNIILEYSNELEEEQVQRLAPALIKARRKIKLLLASAFAEGYHTAIDNAGQPLSKKDLK